jgi:vacuolar-type H+-ATPase subunit E/Vma4
MTGLDKIIEQILAGAREQAKAVLHEAEENCTRLAAEYAQRAEQLRAEIAEASRAEGEQIVEEAKAEAEQVRERAMADAKAEVLAMAVSAAKRELCSPQQNRYRDLLVGLLSSAVLEDRRAQKEQNAPETERYEVVMSGIDHDTVGLAVVESARRMLEREIGADRAARIVLSHERLSIDGGMLLRFDGTILDYSMDRLLGEICEKKAAELSRVLFGA